jgi:tRNA dimethylallyltransferase
MWRTRLTGSRPHRPLIVIIGPTAIGKTGLALDIARAVDGEIIGADSRQVYQHMAIGTAQPTTEQRALIPHHLIDFIAPDENLTLADYQQKVYACVDDIHARGKIPLLVGGTGQYVTAVIEGWTIPEVPPNEAFRAQLESFVQKNTQAASLLYNHLEAIDADAAQKIHPNNTRRVIRALEVYEETGIKISELQRKNPPPYAILELGLSMERQTLYDRADLRVDQMMAEGFLQEVETLLALGYDRNLPSMSGLGYQQLAAHLLDGLPLDEAIHSTKIATHDFIRRQLTWFRKHDNGILWHNVEQTSAQVIVEMCACWLDGC